MTLARPVTPPGHLLVVAATFALMVLISAAALHFSRDRVTGPTPNTEMIVND